MLTLKNRAITCPTTVLQQHRCAPSKSFYFKHKNDKYDLPEQKIRPGFNNKAVNQALLSNLNCMQTVWKPYFVRNLLEDPRALGADLKEEPFQGQRYESAKNTRQDTRDTERTPRLVAFPHDKTHETQDLYKEYRQSNQYILYRFCVSCVLSWENATRHEHLSVSRVSCRGFSSYSVLPFQIRRYLQQPGVLEK